MPSRFTDKISKTKSLKNGSGGSLQKHCKCMGLSLVPMELGCFDLEYSEMTLMAQIPLDQDADSITQGRSYGD